MWPDGDRPLFFDRQGQPVEVLDWARKFEELDYRFVADQQVRGWRVVTIWVGIDSGTGFIMGGPPAIFETAVFPAGDGDADYDGQVRYATEEAARAGHDQVVAWVMDRLGRVAEVPGREIP